MARAVGLALCIAWMHAPGWAQEPAGNAAQPSITVVYRNGQEVYADFRYVLDAAGHANAFRDFKEFLDIYVEGVDLQRPIVSQVIVRSGKLSYVLHVPLTDDQGFIRNIRTLDVRTRPARTAMRDLYEVSGLYKGFLRIDRSAGGARSLYALFGEARNDVLESRASAAAIEASLMARNVDLAFQVENTPAGMDARRKTFSTDVRPNLLTHLDKPKEKESPEDFQVRKLFVTHQVGEMERLFAEIASLTSLWNTDSARKESTWETELKAIAGSDLAASIAQIGAAPSAFGKYKLDHAAVLSGTANFPLDALRRGYLHELAQALRPSMQKRIAARAGRTDAQKSRDQVVATTVLDILDSIAGLGTVDGFVDMRASGQGSQYVAVGAVRTDPSAMTKGLEALKAVGSNVKLDVATEGEVAIHSLPLADAGDEFRKLFGDQSPLYVGVGPNAVWFSMGEGGLERLKSAIRDFSGGGDEKAAAVGLALHAHVGPFVKWWNETHTPPNSAVANVRRFASEAFVGTDDVVEFSLQRQGESVLIRARSAEGGIRFVGKNIGQFIQETFR